MRAVGAVVSTSANDPGGPDPRSLDEIPADLRARVGAVVDGGPLPGTPSTVLDFTAEEPRVLREGAASVGRGAGARARRALARMPGERELRADAVDRDPVALALLGGEGDARGAGCDRPES